MATKSSSPKTGSFAATSVGGRVFFRLRRHAYGEVIDACDGSYTFHIEEGMPENEFVRAYMQQPIGLDELAGRTVPMTKEHYRRLPFTRPDLWRRCLFCPSQEKAYFLDPDYPPDRRILEHRNK